uniref:Uncharacterized protein n=1 Tax=Chrysotila carterae TaxID=13221 RepID=A0A7S4C132_CHRCT|mmetsp:Transcript_34540/g.72687  ORF Transcript_34540/g.72687 Transcript_34540/m.72687 type:complete len:231 (+) Transcript_34540:187-879(+)
MAARSYPFPRWQPHDLPTQAGHLPDPPSPWHWYEHGSRPQPCGLPRADASNAQRMFTASKKHSMHDAYASFAAHSARTASTSIEACRTSEALQRTHAIQPPSSFIGQDNDSEAASSAEAASELELSDEWMSYFAEMELRKEEKRRAARGRRVNGAQSVSSNAVELPQQENEASLVAMRERQGRRAEQDKRYGRHAPEIRALEATLNQEFDQASHEHGNIPLWPSVPLRSG